MIYIKKINTRNNHNIKNNHSLNEEETGSKLDRHVSLTSTAEFASYRCDKMRRKTRTKRDD